MKKHEDQHNNSMFKGAPASSFSKAAHMRLNATMAESRLWEELRGKKFHGLKFRRQHPLQLYMVDFYCHQLKLVIEVDGEYHRIESQRKKDVDRTRAIEEMGIKEIRFTNEEILNHMEQALREIEKQI